MGLVSMGGDSNEADGEFQRSWSFLFVFIAFEPVESFFAR
jgi:hypothetical protein